MIDFDNVTLGIRSDLTKELKSLLNSDIIRGKVAVQRAYADWRRYPQYVMPLTERSIDLIFATAVGSTKKNATDIRLAIDAMELVFTRPEIGTFILLSGDSDFSSLVIKLKEYGKYVIGVGIRESAGDLLIQNCDEYFSYNELAGLTKESDTPSVQRDPWELVQEAVGQMVRQGDVMRSDRLKQVMQQLDSNFDERNAGFNRFSKFVAEAANRRLLKVIKLDNGQFEVGLADTESAPAPQASAPIAPRPEENGSRGRNRGRRGRDRERDRPRGERPPRPSDRAATPVQSNGSGQLTLGAAFALLTRALGELGATTGQEQVRARMAALHGREDPLLETDRFVRLLRQANDAEIAEVRKVGDDSYEVSLPRSARARVPQIASAEPETGEYPTLELPAASADGGSAPAAGGRATAPTLRFRRGSRMPQRPPEIPLIGVVAIDAPVAPSPSEPAAPAPSPRVGSSRGRGSRARKQPQAQPATEAAADAAPGSHSEPEASVAAPKGAGRGGRRGRGGRGAKKSH